MPNQSVRRAFLAFKRNAPFDIYIIPKPAPKVVIIKHRPIFALMSRFCMHACLMKTNIIS